VCQHVFQPITNLVCQVGYRMEKNNCMIFYIHYIIFHSMGCHSQNWNVCGCLSIRRYSVMLYTKVLSLDVI
jgi:hypothetical protein